MPLEIEVKMKVEDHAPLRERLRGLGARRVSAVMETNVFLDTPEEALLAGDRGLRLRTNLNVETQKSTHVVTYKGARAQGPVKKREEIEIEVDDADRARELLAALGYGVALSFQKRRETWKLGDCTVELDELPMLGLFVEIEGPSEDAVLGVRTKLKLDDRETITDPYVGLLQAELVRTGSSARVVMF